MRDLRALPKAELHIHLEGSIRPDTLVELADRQGAPLPDGFTPEGWRFEGPEDFIENYGRACALLNDLGDFQRLGREVCDDLAANGVRYAEAVFSPSNHAARLGGDWMGPIEAVLDGLEQGRRASGVTVLVEPDVVRDLGMEAGEHVLEVALTFAGRGVVALNAAGSEGTDIGPFAPLFRRAKDAGLRSVPHAGEWAGPENVWKTLEHYLPDRIGHGVRSIDDPRLVEHLAERGIPLEVSPLSNVATGAYPSLAEHPFLALREAGVVVTLNSDDPPMFDGWLADVYGAARSAWGLSDEELAEIARTGVRASFADDATKAEIVGGIDAWLAEPQDTAGETGVSPTVPPMCDPPGS
jgi:adenosine deaminase